MAKIGWLGMLLPSAALAQGPVEGAGENWGLQWIVFAGVLLAILLTLYFVYALERGSRGRNG
jgi:hypothetical protein